MVKRVEDAWLKHIAGHKPDNVVDLLHTSIDYMELALGEINNEKDIHYKKIAMLKKQTRKLIDSIEND